jgi:hypothetical protein
MKLGAFTLRLGADGAFNDTELVEFIRSTNVIDYMLELGGDPRWAVLVSCQPVPSGSERPTQSDRRD